MYAFERPSGRGVVLKRWQKYLLSGAALVLFAGFVFKSSDIPLDAGSFTQVLPGGTPEEKVDNTREYGRNKITIASTEWLGYQLSANTCARRDLGFTGKLGDRWYALHGDALWCAEGISNPEGDIEYQKMVRNTLSLMGDDVLKPVDLYTDGASPVQHPTQFFPIREEWGENVLSGFGGTSICAITDTMGIVYYAPNDFVNGLRGAGVARVELVEGQHNMTVKERLGEKGIWWDAKEHPRYGDISAYRDEQSDYIYALGGPPTSVKDFASANYVYQVRVHKDDAFDLSKYEYWHGRKIGWMQEPLRSFTPESAVMWNVGQGQIVWSPFYKCYFFVHTENGSDRVVIRTAEKPEGPWSNDMIVYNAKVVEDGGQVYSGVAHPYLDESGKTLTITYTNHPNNIEGIKVTFR